MVRDVMFSIPTGPQRNRMDERRKRVQEAVDVAFDACDEMVASWPAELGIYQAKLWFLVVEHVMELLETLDAEQEETTVDMPRETGCKGGKLDSEAIVDGLEQAPCLTVTTESVCVVASSPQASSTTSSVSLVSLPSSEDGSSLVLQDLRDSVEEVEWTVSISSDDAASVDMQTVPQETSTVASTPCPPCRCLHARHKCKAHHSTRHPLQRARLVRETAPRQLPRARRAPEPLHRPKSTTKPLIPWR